MTARQMGFLKLGKVSLDGTKVKVNASKHRALSWGHANKIEKQLKKEVQKLLRMAEAADREDVPDGMKIPEELSRRRARLEAIARAKAEIEDRAKERHARELEAYEEKMAKRQKKKPHQSYRQSIQDNACFGRGIRACLKMPRPVLMWNLCS